jgi:hypothetical protein
MLSLSRDQRLHAQICVGAQEKGMGNGSLLISLIIIDNNTPIECQILITSHHPIRTI